MTITVQELKRRVEQGKDNKFFSPNNMRFFGDTMFNYGVKAVRVDGAPAWELFRKKPVKHGLKKSAFFSMSTNNRIFATGKKITDCKPFINE